ncbi:MAG: hypothetical protein HC788_04950 [Sphingopyxis sp.]|nr:hypothetical protein [Sphingopyxis sp.]
MKALAIIETPDQHRHVLTTRHPETRRQDLARVYGSAETIWLSGLPHHADCNLVANRLRPFAQATRRELVRQAWELVFGDTVDWRAKSRQRAEGMSIDRHPADAMVDPLKADLQPRSHFGCYCRSSTR